MLTHTIIRQALFLLMLLSVKSLTAMESKPSPLSVISKDLFFKICASKRYNIPPWQELGDVFQLRRVCTTWNDLLADYKTVAKLLHILPMHCAAAMGDADEIIHLKLEGHSERKYDENMLLPIDYAIGFKQQKTIKILLLAEALREDQKKQFVTLPIIPGTDNHRRDNDLGGGIDEREQNLNQLLNEINESQIHEYTFQDIMDALTNDQPEKLENILLNNTIKENPLIANIDLDQSSLWSKRCTDRIFYVVRTALELTLYELINPQEACPDQFLETFKKYGANPNAYHLEGETLLFAACTVPEKFPIVQFLLQYKNIDVNCVSENKKTKGMTPLHTAIISNNGKAFQALLDTKACNINALANEWGTPLHCTAQKNNIPFMKLLIDNNAEIYSKNQLYFNNTPLHVAAIEGSLEAVIYLCGLAHCKINIKDTIGRTPLSYAINSNNLSCMHYLLNQKADINAINTMKANLLHTAVAHNSYQCFSDLLPIMQDKVNGIDNLGFTPLHYAALYNYLDFVSSLIRANALVNKQNLSGDMPIHYAAAEGHIAVIKELLKNGSEINSANYKDVYFSRTKDPRGNFTPLHHAAYKGHLDVIKILIEYNADPTARTQLDKTALDIAKERNHSVIMEFLTK